jgi:hypothetical protein
VLIVREPAELSFSTPAPAETSPFQSRLPD